MSSAELSALYDHKCGLCPLFKDNYSVCLGGVGNASNPKLVIVGDAPSRDEDAVFEAYTTNDQRARLLLKVLKAVGLSIKDCYATYLAKCCPRGSLKVKEARVCYEEYLKRELNVLRPELILALGKTVQQVLLRNTASIAKTHGKLFPFVHVGEDEDGEEVEVWSTRVMPVEHPFAVLLNPARYDGWLADFKRVKEILGGEGDPFYTPSKLDRYTFDLIDSIDKLRQVINTLELMYRGSYIAFDVEASGLDDVIFTPDFKWFTLQFGVVDLARKAKNDSLPVYIVPVDSAHFACCRGKTWKRDVIVELQNLFGGPFKFIAHNAKYDQKVLWRHEIPVFSDACTMVLWANRYGEASMSLKDIAYQVTDIGGYEGLMDDFFAEHNTYDAPPDILLPYGGLDVVVTRHLFYRLEREVLRKTKKV